MVHMVKDHASATVPRHRAPYQCAINEVT